MNINTKLLGPLLLGFAIILLFVLTFVKIDNDKKSEVLCEKFSANKLDMKDCPAHQSNFSWMIIIAYGIGFLILLVGVYIIFVSNGSADTKKDFKPIDISKLNDEERNFYDIIRNKGGSSYQIDLIKETGFSKVKTKRILDKMELRGILERKRRGMTNIIVLK